MLYLYIFEYIEPYHGKRCNMKKAKYLAMALVLSLGMVVLACSQPVGYVSDNSEAVQTVIPLQASPPTAWVNIDLCKQYLSPLYWTVTATVTVTENDASGPAIAGATVSAYWSGVYGSTRARPANGTTNTYGKLSLVTVMRESDIVTFTVTKIVKNGQEYILSGETSDSTSSGVEYDLTIASTAGGNVTIPGEGTYTYDPLTVVNLVATPDAGHRFVEWIGDVGTIADVHGASTTIAMNGDYAITANFVAIYDLNVSSTGGGSVTEPGEGVFTYDTGTVVNLVASPNTGCRFVNWTGDVSTIANVNAATTIITMNGDYAVTANFVVMYDLAISSTTGGSVTTPGEGVFAYDGATVVDLAATPNAGYRFMQWTGDVDTIADVHGASTTITMNGNYSVTANFEATAPWVPPVLLQYSLIVLPGTGGSVTSPGVGVFAYDPGAVVNLVATPANSYRFVRWSGGVDTIENVNAASTAITMNKDYSVTANFVAIHDLSISSTEGGSVTEPGEGAFTYDEGTVVDLVAEAEKGYRFVEWTGDVGAIANAYAAETTFTMNGDYSITADFEEVSQAYPTVTTQAATNISTSSARLEMSYTVGDFSPVQVCFAYRKSADSTWSYTAWMSKTADGTHAEVLTELEFNTTYDFKSRLKYNGIVIGGTTLQFTTDTPSPSGSGPCFIATAAYGTPTAKQIDLLREFRDVVLLKSTAGSQFVVLYYQLSPPIANFIAANEVLTTLIRDLLVDPIVWVVRATRATRGGIRIN
jgi:hypothetical protein